MHERAGYADYLCAWSVICHNGDAAVFKRLLVFTLIFAAVLPCAGCLSGLSPRPLTFVRTSLNITLGSPGVNSEKFNDSLNRLTHSREIPGNSVKLLQNGECVYPKMLEAIKSAKKRICITMYDFKSDQIGSEFTSALCEAARRGVEVRFLYDYYGSEEIDLAEVCEIIKCGGQVRAFNKPKVWLTLQYNNRTHRKILVIDGFTSFMGGLNIGDCYNGNGIDSWRDMALMVQGPASHRVEQIFAQIWNKSAGLWFGQNLPFVGTDWLKRIIDKPFVGLLDREWLVPPYCAGAVGATSLRVVEQSPEWMDSYMLNLYLLAINSAENSIYIMTGYFVPPVSVKRALINAARRGVDVRILTQHKSDQRNARRLSVYSMPELIRNGVKIYGWQKNILHGKAFVADGKFSYIGSANLDGRALFVNYEAGYATADKTVCMEMNRQLLEDFSLARQYTLDDCKEMIESSTIWLLPIRGQF